MSGWFVKYRIALLTTAGILLAVAVAGVTGFSSWGHIVAVGRAAAEPSAALLPVAVDGMMLSGTAMAAVDTLRGRKPRGWSIVGMWLGSAMTLTFNVASAWERGIVAMMIACVYAVALLVTVETLFHPSKRYLDEKRRSWRRESDTMISATLPVPVSPAPAPGPLAPAFSAEPASEPIVAELVEVPVVRPRRRRAGKGYPTPTDHAIMLREASGEADEVMIQSGNEH